MSFWGVEIQSGKPYVHSDEDGMTTLHLSQATLGLTAKVGQRPVVKCKVGENPEVLLCSLRVGVQETCTLDLLFDQEVTFSVVGGASVHLTGYYLDDASDSEDDEDDSDSEEDGLEFIEDDEDVSDLEGHPASVIEDVAKKAILAITNGEKKRKKGDSAVKAAKADDTVMDVKAAAEETPAKKQAVAGGDGVPTPGAATPTSQGRKRNRKNKKNQNGSEAVTPTAGTPTSQGKKKLTSAEWKKLKETKQSPEACPKVCCKN